jgi:hypothetical protein
MSLNKTNTALQTNEKSIFDDLTNRYQISKTLRFELKPTPETELLLKNNHVLEKDEMVSQAYAQVKYYFDKVHQRLIQEALSQEKVSTNKVMCDAFFKLKKEYELFLKLPKEKRYSEGKGFQKAQQEMRDVVVELLKNTATDSIKEWRDDYIEEHTKKTKIGGTKKTPAIKDGVDFLFSGDAIKYLAFVYPPEKNDALMKEGAPSLFVADRYIFDVFSGFTGYLEKFQATRENLYEADGKAPAIATRVIKNLLRFLDNGRVFEEIKKREKEHGGTLITDNFDSWAHTFVQAGIEDYNKTVGEINKQVKMWRDTKRGASKKEYPRLKTLDKQILADVVKRVELIERPEDVPIRFSDFVKQTKKRIGKDTRTLFKDLLVKGVFDEELDTIWINGKTVNSLAHVYFSDPRSFLNSIPSVNKKAKKEDEDPKLPTFVSLADIIAGMDTYAFLRREGGVPEEYAVQDEQVQIFKEKFYNKTAGNDVACILAVDERRSYKEQLFAIWDTEWDALYTGEKAKNRADNADIVGFNDALEKAEILLQKETPTYTEEDKKVVKEYADAVLRIQRRLSGFALESYKIEELPAEDVQNGEFYTSFDALFRWGNIEISYAPQKDGRKKTEMVDDEKGKPLCNRFYDALRNELTKKPDSKDKIKIQFDESSFLGGWDKSMEETKLGVVLRNNNKYFLAIINKEKNRKVFTDPRMYETTTSDDWEKMVYKCLGDVKRQIPRVAFSKKFLQTVNIPHDDMEEIKKIKKEYEKFQEQKGKDKDMWDQTFDKIKEQKLIAYYQHVLTVHEKNYAKEYGLIFKKPEEYKGVGDFNNHMTSQMYRMCFVPISHNVILEKERNGEVYLFEIHNKDWNLKDGKEKKAVGKNLHTRYFEALFSSNGNKNLKLNGDAEMFYRNERLGLKPKKDNKGKDVLDGKRYAKSKWLLHLPITINWMMQNVKQKKYNSIVNECIVSKNDQVNIIGIDRGEKHLAYYMVTDQKENILDGASLNTINGVPYAELLHTRMKERLEDRKSWKPARQIKDLKEGYVGAVVYKLACLAIEHNAIIVMEDLSFRFKQVRGGVEKSVYQQIEKRLIEKFGYLVFKDRDITKPGGVLHGFQLSAPFESFEKMGKQTGIIFYTNASYTSACDPLTGFRKHVYIQSGKIRETFEKFESIAWDEKESSFCFVYDATKFAFEKKGKKQSKEKKSKFWHVYGKAPRIVRKKNKEGYWEASPIDVDAELNTLFKEYHFDTGKELKSQIFSRKKEELYEKRLISENGKESKRSFWERLAYLFNMACQLRNALTPQYRLDEKGNAELVGDDVDFIASPVPPFFTTGTKHPVAKHESNFADFEKRFDGFVGENKEQCKKDFNGDANGAYNIARKGAIILQKMHEYAKEHDGVDKMKPNELSIGMEDWDTYTRNT